MQNFIFLILRARESDTVSNLLDPSYPLYLSCCFSNELHQTDRYSKSAHLKCVKVVTASTDTIIVNYGGLSQKVLWVVPMFALQAMS